ncbi:hypothetical protein COE51_16360 [Bacillus pseudomycoides]|nr:hypothetical protein COE51_16360 [Bacillus pseudomycoides]
MEENAKKINFVAVYSLLLLGIGIIFLFIKFLIGIGLICFGILTMFLEAKRVDSIKKVNKIVNSILVFLSVITSIGILLIGINGGSKSSSTSTTNLEDATNKEVNQFLEWDHKQQEEKYNSSKFGDDK